MLRKRCAKDPARTAGQFGDLLTEHLEIGGALVTDLKNRETAKADDARRRHQRVSCRHQRLLERRKMARIFLQPSGDDGKETTLRLQGDYAADIRMFDRIETEALRMAAYMFCGLAMRCR